MKLLLDTHAFIWIISEPARLSKEAQHPVLAPETQLHLSAASYWEICIEHSLGKLGFTANWPEQFDQEMSFNKIMWLPIAKEHCQAVIQLDDIHNDPFDRLLVAQARTENMTVLTVDPNIPQYGVKTIS